MKDKKYWSQYWEQGHQTSFGTFFKTGYQGVIKSHWEQVFKSLTKTSSVLDLCTGNASLLRLASGVMSDFSSHYFTGVDYAKVSLNDSFEQLANVTLLFDTNIESLPLPEKSFDLIVSNFGVEYSNFNLSLMEASRLLKPEGRVEFLCHHHKSIIVLANNKELAMLNEMISSGNALDCLFGLLKSLAGNKRLAEHWRHKLNAQLTDLNSVFVKEFQQSDFLKFLRFVLKPSVEDKLDKFNLFKEDVLGHRNRLNTLNQAALNKLDIENLPDIFRKSGLLLNGYNEIKNNEGVVAYKLSGKKVVDCVTPED